MNLIFFVQEHLKWKVLFAKIVNARRTKNIEEKAAYETSHTVITQSSSGFCPPKIQGNCFVEAVKNASSQFTCFQVALPRCLNLASGIFQTMKNLDLLRNLSTLDPITTISEIFLIRFVTSFTFMDVETKTTIDTKIPHQSHIDIEVLNISNDRTHLESIINVEKKAKIETGQFTTYAPQVEQHQHTETHGFSISISPVAHTHTRRLHFGVADAPPAFCLND